MYFGSEVTNYPILTGATNGTEVTPGASGAWGSWTVLIAGASNTRGAVYHRTNITRYFQASVDRRLLVDLGMRPAGASGSEITLVPRLMAGKANSNQAYGPAGTEFEGPVRIPAGYDLVCRAMSNQSSPATCWIMASIYADPLYGQPHASVAEAIGIVDANVQGTTVSAFDNGTHATPGYGTTWTLIGATTRESKFLDAAVTFPGTNDNVMWMTLRLSAGDASNKTVISEGGMWGCSSGEMFSRRRPSRVRNKIPAGINLYAQIASQTTMDACVALYSYF